MKKTLVKVGFIFLAFVGFCGILNFQPGIEKAFAQMSYFSDEKLSEYIELYDVDFQLVTSTKGVRVIFFYNAGNEDCQNMATYMNTLPAGYKGKVYFYKVDAETQTEYLSKYNIENVPAIIVFKNGVKKIDIRDEKNIVIYMKAEIDKLLADPNYKNFTR